MDDTPAYNLKAVVRETGLKPDTLRAWERRYGLPTPDRSDGGHRLYSARDIEVLKWLVARQQEGLSISRAADLWHRLTAQGQDPVRMPEYAGLASARAIAIPSGGREVDELKRSWLAACMTFDEVAAEAALGQAAALYPVESLCLDLLIPGMAEIGDRWYRGEATPHQEHFASELAERRLNALLAASPTPLRPGRLLIVCPPEEQHTFIALLITLLLRRRGWPVTYLGANVPAGQFEATLDEIQPRLVVMPAQTLHAAATMLALARSLQSRGLPLAVGGNAFSLHPSLNERLPAHFLGGRLDRALEAIEALLASAQPSPEPASTPISLEAAGTSFAERRASIMSQVTADLSSAGIPPDRLKAGVAYLAQAIEDGLALGDPELVGDELGWLRGLRANGYLQEDWLTSMLLAYRDAIHDRATVLGQPVVEGLDRVLGDRQ